MRPDHPAPITITSLKLGLASDILFSCEGSKRKLLDLSFRESGKHSQKISSRGLHVATEKDVKKHVKRNQSRTRPVAYVYASDRWSYHHPH